MADATQNASTDGKVKNKNGVTNAEQIISKHGTLIRHRFTVPSGDTDVETWVNNQSNLSFSLRMAIKLLISEFGAEQDITCLGMPSPVKKVGRPRKDNSEAIGSFSMLQKPNMEQVAPVEPESDDDMQNPEPVQAQETVSVDQEITVEQSDDIAPEQIDMNDLRF